MDSFWMAKQWIDFQKTTTDNVYNAWVMMQDHTERAANTLFEQASWFPEEGKRQIYHWIDLYKKGREDLKAAYDDNLGRMKDFFTV